MEKESELLEIKGFIKRRKKGFIIAFSLIFMIGVSIALFLTPIYTSEVMIRIQDQQIPENFVQSTVSDYAEERIQKLSRHILSRSKLLEIIDRFDLYPEMRDKESPGQLARLMSKNIELDTISAAMQNQRSGKDITATVAFTLSYDGKDPVKVQQVTDTLSKLFLEEDIKERARFISGTTDFLKNELQRLKMEGSRQEKIISDFQQNHTGELPDQRGYNLQAIARLERELDSADMQLRLLQEQKILLEARIAKVDPLTPIIIDGEDLAINPAERLKRLRLEYLRMQSVYSEKHPDIRKKKQEIIKLEQEVKASEDSVGKIKKLKQLEVKYASVKAKLGSKHPNVTAIKKEIDILNKQFDNFVTTNTKATISEENPDNPIYITLKTQIETTEMKIKALLLQKPRLISEIDEYRRRVENAPMVEKELNSLTRDNESLIRKYSEISNKLMNAELAQQMEGKEKGERFKITSPAYLPNKPSKPNRLTIIVLSFALALCLSTGLVVFQEYIDDSINTSNQLKKLTNIPVFSEIPYVETREEKRQRRVKNLLWTAAAVAFAGIALLIVDQFLIELDQAWEVVIERIMMIA